MAPNRDIDDFLKGYSKLETPDERMDSKVEGTLLFDRGLKEYEKLLQNEDLFKIPSPLDKLDAILTPQQINSFLQSTIRYEQNENYICYTGAFISRLMQNSYNARHNGFFFNTSALKEIDNMAYKIKGTHLNPIRVKIEGNVGTFCGQNSQHVSLDITGEVSESCGQLAKNIEVRIDGNSGPKCGLNSIDSKFMITGDAEFSLGNSSVNCEFILKRLAEGPSGWEAKKSVFKTPNSYSLEVFKKSVICGLGNKIYFIKPDGKEKRIWRMRDIIQPIWGTRWQNNIYIY
ncbi:MAG: hypothetical protein ABIB71_04330 [Candidatus Woesearchaeota archaeon]